MRLLLDTHTLLWLQDGDARLSATGKTLITDPANQRYWSMADA